MKKAIGMMALGMGMGAGMMYMYNEFQNGNLTKTVNKGVKEVKKAAKKLSN